MTSIAVSQNGNRSRKNSRKSSNEVDAVGNPTELFRRINSGDWEGALNAVKTNPVEASIWVSRRKNNDGGLAWKYLPLHLICLQQRPPLELFLALLQFYPQAASLSTPHDGNLPIHYVCESGCDDEHVFGALLASFPKSLEIKNNKDKTPLLVCHTRSRGLLMKVLRQRKPLPFSDGQHKQNKRDKDKKSSRPSRKGSEQRNDIDTSSHERTHSSEYRQGLHNLPPQTMPARFAQNRHSNFVDAESTIDWVNSKTPKASNHRRSSKKQVVTDETPFFATKTSSSSDGDDTTDTGSYLSSKTTELALTALNYLYPSYQGDSQQSEDDDGPIQEQHVRSLTKKNAAQQQTIKDLTKKLDEITSSNEGNTESSKLCERILAKAEEDNIGFRTQIQKLRDEKEEIRRTADLKEKADKKHLDQMRNILRQKGSEMKIDVFGDGSSSRSSGDSSGSKDQIVEALKTVLSHMDERNKSLDTKIDSLEAALSTSEVALKMTQSKNHALQGEKDSMVKERRELESRASILDEEKDRMQTGLGDLKDRISTLSVIKQSLEEQLDSLSNGELKQENNKLRSELSHLNAQLSRMRKEKENAVESQHDHHATVEMEEKITSLLEKNRSLKDAIMFNNEKYSKKVQELGERYSTLEKSNKELRQSLASRSSNGTQPDMRVHLEGESKLLYEV